MEFKEWFASIKDKEYSVNTLGEVLRYNCPREIYLSIEGDNTEEKADYLYNLINEQSEEKELFKDKTDLKVLIADNSESKEIIDFLNLRFNVEIFVENEGVKSGKVKIKEFPDVIVFTGGEDIDPSYYDQQIGEFTTINSERDRIESDIYHRYRNVPKIGIGRGAQFLTVMRGGSIIQHVDGHNKPHKILTTDGNSFDNIDSDHHQMMFPYHLMKGSYDILAWTKLFRSSMYLDGKNQQIDLPRDFIEIEIIQYNIHALCFQVHPELSSNNAFKKKCLRYIASFLDKEESKKKSLENNYDSTSLDLSTNKIYGKYIPSPSDNISYGNIGGYGVDSLNRYAGVKAPIKVRSTTSHRLKMDGDKGYDELYDTVTGETISLTQITGPRDTDIIINVTKNGF